MNYKHALIMEVADQGKSATVHLVPLRPQEVSLMAHLQAEKGTATRLAEKTYYAGRIQSLLEKICTRDRIIVEHPGKKPPQVEEIMIKEGESHRVLNVSERSQLVKAYRAAQTQATRKPTTNQR